MTAQLTDRQEAIMGLIQEGLGAREIAEKLNISRNAVYQQITALKKKGALDSTFTPSGETRIPPRPPSTDIEPREHAMQYLMAGDAAPSQANVPALEAIRELIAMNRDLVNVVADLSAKLGSKR